MIGLLVLAISGEQAFAYLTFEDCNENIDVNLYEDDYRNCRNTVLAINAADAGVDCIECITSQQQKSNPWLEALGIVAAPLAFFGSAYVGAKYAYKTQKQWANAYETGYNACTSQFNSALDYNISSGATSYTASELSGMMGACNGGGLGGAYAGYGGLIGNGYGGVGNPWLSAGYSGGFMSGMMGPYYGNGAGININAGVGGGLGSLLGGLFSGNGLSINAGAGINVGGGFNNGFGNIGGMNVYPYAGGAVGYPIGGLQGNFNIGGNPWGMNYGRNIGMPNAGINANFNLGANAGWGLNRGLNNGLMINGNLGLNNNFGLGNNIYGAYGRNPYLGVGAAVNLGYNNQGQWGYPTTGAWPNYTGYVGLPGTGLGGQGMISGNIGVGNPYVNGAWGTGANGNWHPSGSYYNNTGAGNQYWQQQQQAWQQQQQQQAQAYGQASARNSIDNQINVANYNASLDASTSLYNNYAQAGQALSANQQYQSYGAYGQGAGGYYGSIPYGAGNLGANFSIGGYAGIGF